MENSYDPSYGHQPPQQHTSAASAKRTAKSGARSIEYVFLAIALMAAAASFILLAIVWANGALTGDGTNIDSLAFPTSVLVVALPVFMALLFDLKRAEFKRPSLKSDPYKMWSAQFVKVAAFTTCFFALVSLVYGILTHSSSDNGGSIGYLFLDVFIVLAVAGGILAYYLINERSKP